jgi:hypothetical protein
MIVIVHEVISNFNLVSIYDHSLNIENKWAENWSSSASAILAVY